MDRLESSARAAVIALLGVIALAAFITVARAEPFHPVDPELVLLRIPAGDADGELAASERRYRDEPGSIASALQLAAAHVERGRRTGEARHFGRAEAILQSWQSRATDSAQWHVLLADIRQYRHDYAHALGLLDRAIELDPAHVHAHLMRAAIHQTRGEFDPAQADCRTLLSLRESALGLTCLAQVRSLTGDLERAQALLDRQLAADEDREADAATRAWMLGALAEMAERGGDVERAERLLREAMQTEPWDSFNRLTLVDLLLADGRASTAQELVRDQAPSAAILLRRAEVARALGRDAQVPIEALQGALAESGQRGERIDGRLIARLRLLEHRHCEALTAARENWKSQRESTDVRLLIRTAQACGGASALQELAAWRAATRYQDAVADALLVSRKRPT